MKFILAAIALLVGTASLTPAAVTINFSDSTNYLSNFANGAGVSVAFDGSNRMVWGVLVDGGNDGFDGIANLNTSYLPGFSLAANSTGIALSMFTLGIGTTPTNDVLFIASALMASNLIALDGSSLSMNRVTTFTDLTYSGNVAAGKSFAIVWFNQTALGGTAEYGLKFGVFSTHLVLPADPGSYNLASNFAGADQLKFQSYSITPEPSTSIMAMLALATIFKRRR